MANPDYLASTPTEYGEGDSKKTKWTNIGVAFRTKDKQGLNVILNALPVNGKIYLQKYVPKEKKVDEGL